MVELSPRQQEILSVVLANGPGQSSNVHAALVKDGKGLSLVTVKRALSKMSSQGVLAVTGSGRATSYEITALGRIAAAVSAHEYCSAEPDKRYGLDSYNFNLLPALPPDIFSDDELQLLNGSTAKYEQRTKDSPPAIQKKELERLIIELSWKSSKIEGNTYTLLDTERLILENKEAPGHDKNEARMILNHKEAFNYVRTNAAQFRTVTRRNLGDLHAVLVKDLSVGLGFRKKPVGVVGSKYRPLDNIYQITEAVNDLAAAVARMTTPYAKALVALLGIGYIQPFEDGNKRTSRLMANALLLAGGAAPLSYRSVDENDYREAMLVFYELNAVAPFKKIFIDQYNFAAQNYAVK